MRPEIDSTLPAFSTGPDLPYPAEPLVAHRPPMLLVRRIMAREGDRARIEALVPEAGIFLHGDQVLPEYLVEVVAQAMAVVNGFDAMRQGRRPAAGYLVGVDHFSWGTPPKPGELISIDLVKTFQFEAVTVIKGLVRNSRNEILGEGGVKVWEQKDAAAS